MIDRMKEILRRNVAACVMAAVGVATIIVWACMGPKVALEVRVPKETPGGAQASEPVERRPLQGVLTTGTGVAADIAGAWPRFRGAGFDNIHENAEVALARQWPGAGPAKLWSLEVGEGYAGAAVWQGRVYLLDYDRQGQADALRCLSLADGQEIWRFSYPVKVKRNHGMSRTVPAVTDDFVVTLGPKCQVACLNPVTGQAYWLMDLVERYGTKVPQWYAGQCPLIDDEGRAILAPGGTALMTAIDCKSGQTVWETPNANDWQMTHSSIMPMEYAGRKMYVYCASGGVVGVSAADGSVLWETSAWRIRMANVPSPVIVGDGRIFLSGGYNAGAMMMQVKEEQAEGKLAVEVLYRLKPEVFGSPQHTPILYGGHLYGVRPDEELVCLDLAGQVVWTSGTDYKFGLGPYMMANGLMYLMNDEGLLTLAEVSPSVFAVLAEAKVLEGPDSWGPMAMAGGRLLVRDMNVLKCLDVRAR